MAINVGVTPPDYNSPTGQFRLLANDVVATPLSPPSTGYGTYALFSDSEIGGFIAIYPDNALRAVGTAYLSLAGRAAMEAKLVKDFDLQVDLSKRADMLREVAQEYFARADAEAVLEGTDSTFGISAPAIPDRISYAREIFGDYLAGISWEEHF